LSERAHVPEVRTRQERGGFSGDGPGQSVDEDSGEVIVREDRHPIKVEGLVLGKPATVPPGGAKTGPRCPHLCVLSAERVRPSAGVGEVRVVLAASKAICNRMNSARARTAFGSRPVRASAFSSSQSA